MEVLKEINTQIVFPDLKEKGKGLTPLREWNDPVSLSEDPIWSRSIHPQDRESVLSLYKFKLQTQSPFEVRYRVEVDNKYHWVLDSGTPLINSEKQFQGFYRVQIIDRHEQPVPFCPEKEEVKQCFENSGLGVQYLDRNGMILWTNKTFLQVTGYTEHELFNHHITEFIAETSELLEFMFSLENKEPVKDVVIRFQCKDEYRYFCLSTSSSLNHDQFEFTRCFMQDITELKHKEEKMRESNRVLKLINSISNSLSANLDLHPLLQTITDASTAVSGARFGSFYIVSTSDKGTRELLLYTTSGSPVGGFARNPIPTKLLAISKTEQIERIANLSKCYALKDFTNFACSCLSVPVIARNGDLLGKIMLFHTSESFFTETAETLVSGIASHAAIAIDNCRLFEEKKNNEQRFRILAESIPQMVWTARSDGTLDYCNQRWVDYTGLTLSKSFGTGWLQMIHRSDLFRGMRKWKDCLSNGNPYESEFRIRNGKTGKFRWHLVRALPIADKNNKVVKWFGTCTDIEEQKQNVQVKDDFIGIASHELKTPLTSLKAYIQLVERTLKDEANETVKGYLAKTNTHVNRVNALISDLLDISRIQSGKLQFKMTWFNINNLVTETVDSIQQACQTHRIIKIGNADLEYFGDRQRLEQVICNYLNNAIKYSPKAEEIEIETRIEEKKITIAFRDNGIGIAPDKLEKIFDRYYRINEASKAVGLGIGLYISKEIIRKHNGRTWAESQEGKGTTFFIELPLL